MQNTHNMPGGPACSALEKSPIALAAIAILCNSLPKPATSRRRYCINFPVFHVLQKWRRATPSYLESVQTDMNASMRAILVDWLVEVCQEYRLVSDTLFLAVSYLDRYLSLVPVSRSRLQLVGVTCLLLAAKYEEIYAPQVGAIWDLLPIVCSTASASFTGK